MAPVWALPSFLKSHKEEPVVSQQCADLVRKQGYVARIIKNLVEVEVGDETVEFSLKNVEATFSPLKFDQIVLYCEIDENSHDITVRRIEVPNEKRIQGRVTSIEPGRSGYIEGTFLFYWAALDNCADDIKRNDEVKASCVEYKTDDNTTRWRCFKVTRISQPTANVSVTVPNKDVMNKNGIEITETVAVEFNDLNETKDFQMIVRNTSSDDVKVIESMFKGNLNDSQLELEWPTRRSNFEIKSGDEKIYKFKATSKRFGSSHENFTIFFEGEKAGKFRITRFIKVTVHDTELQHRTIGTGRNVQTNVEYTRSVLERSDVPYIAGPSPSKTLNFVATKFDSWRIPAILRETALKPGTSRSAILDALEKICPHLSGVLTAEHYTRVFHDLLHLEECTMEHNIRKYDVKSYFTRDGEYLALAVQNVAESRPSLVVGDFIDITDPWPKENENKICQRGNIHEVKKDHILVKFNECFHNQYKNEDYQITFHFSRNSLKKQHHAIELSMKTLSGVLFPTEIVEINKQLDVELNLNTGELTSGNSIIPWFNSTLNIVQKQAITNILHGVARPMPYVIFGPPGTGKTVTVIETILQIVKNLPSSRLLVATPSNSAANLITERIVASGVLTNNQFMRLVGHNSISRNAIPSTILQHCGTVDKARVGTSMDEFEVAEDGLQRSVNAKRLKSYRILIGTCTTLGTLMQCEIPQGHFTHVIIDESGQSKETESIIPMSFVDKDVGQIILAGDPQQLGPVVLSPFAKKFGLAQSFLDRLLIRDLYKPDQTKFEHHYDPRLLTKLVNNYRSVPEILNLYSDLFYDASLKAMINDVDSDDAKVLHSLTRILPNNKPNGVVFIGVNGKNETCSDSPSWYNRKEADAVKTFLDKLVKLGQKPDDIGIITPYQEQVKAIRKELIRHEASTAKVGTVEEFQGQERKIILISTVRTLESQLSNDLRYSLGFINHPNRMNVAVSRARSLLVVFGSPKLLSLDDNWNQLIENCKKQGSYVRCDGDDE